MTKPLHKLIPESIYHRKNHFWFDDNGTVYYGPDENNLTHPGGLDAMGKLEAIFLTDLVNTFKLGLGIGRAQSSIREAAQAVVDAQIHGTCEKDYLDAFKILVEMLE